MLSFISVALLVYGSMHLYAFGKVWRVFPHSPRLALVLALAGVVLTFSPIIIHYMEGQGWHSATLIGAWAGYTWMGFLFLFFCIIVVFDLVHALISLLHIKCSLSEVKKLRAAGLLALAALGYGLIEARQIHVEEIKVTTPKLASGRVTLAQISDLHLGIMMGDVFLERVIARLREIKPDIVVATGDIVDGQGDNLEGLVRRFQACAPPLGAYAVIGNHEHHAGLDSSLRFLRSAGFNMLRGESVTAGGIMLAGVDDPGAHTPDQALRPDTRKKLASAIANNFIVLLKHQPVVDSDTPFDLQLSGHIHGGQIFPFVYLTRLVYGVHTGLTRLADGRLLYVNRGAGTWGPPIRLFTPPEITLITIESEKK